MTSATAAAADRITVALGAEALVDFERTQDRTAMPKTDIVNSAMSLCGSSKPTAPVPVPLE